MRSQDLMVDISLEGRRMSQIESYNYRMGAMVTKDGKCEGEVLKRIAMANTRFDEMRKLLTNMNISMRLWLRLLKCFIWSVLVYVCKACTLDGKLRRRLDVVEVRFLRRMLRAPWTPTLSNERVMKMAGVSKGNS